MMGFDVWTEDISQAYLKTASKLLHEVYLRSNKYLQGSDGFRSCDSTTLVASVIKHVRFHVSRKAAQCTQAVKSDHG